MITPLLIFKPKFETMFKTEVVDSKNIRKTTVYKIIQIILIIILLFFFSLSFHIFGKDSAIESFISNNYRVVIQPIMMVIVVFVVVFSMIMRARMKNPRVLGSVEIDENELKFIGIDSTVKTYRWSELEGVNFEFFSTSNRNNQRGCLNYLTILKDSNYETFEIIVENSLSKSELGDIFREINIKVPVKIRYSTLFKMIFRDVDFKLR
jgi:hypothetical protein